ncbi:FAD-binding oxidoreductase [Phaeocystidibacter marisrubri]|uniref:FAD-binding protein n=1 Tax=Phaeocystidibacter marisrubri TaxID=1577780 RepID=A0A6L3ZJT0_9FLAO|nr:FAD-linked oxidase C-terminal domain-containing protein [Phaeocystidibacter marisrubri]KAB2818151.1 FAD-binding protein [Phaeocystidibacter marisrubri]GGH71686.1 dehydrogenase [Phaeocystidibacter marisrubri]
MDEFTKLTQEHVTHLQKLLGNEGVRVDEESLREYGHDETEDLVHMPEAVVFPSCVDEVSALLKYANENVIPVTAVGARTGLSGGALSTHGGIALSMEKFNAILEIDQRNFQATVEPGVINYVFHSACKEKGLFYPPDPSSWGSCTLGGNLAYNAGGPKAVKYGVTNQYVLNLEVVLANGDVIWTGANVLKNSTGYNLTQLMVGSEGTLGIITKIVFKLLPYPSEDLTLLVPFTSAEKACEAVSAIFHAGITPSGMEFMEKDAIDWTLKYVDDVSVPTGDHIRAHLLIELDGNDREALYTDAEKIAALVEDFDAVDVLIAESQAQRDALWKLRRRVGEAVKSHSIYKEEDTVVPRAELPKLLRGVKEIGEKYGFKSVCYGHAGDGNLHVNIVKGNMTDEAWEVELPKGISEIFKLVVSLGGTLSGEHGIGFVQKNYMDIVFNHANLAVQRAIKKALDPKGILNPGKIFPDQHL